MVTQCTACQVWFEVMRDQLHAAHGLVRCSACATVFNALATLRHDVPDADAGADPEAVSSPLPAVEGIGDTAIPEAAPESGEFPSPPPEVETDTRDNIEGEAWQSLTPQSGTGAEQPSSDVAREAQAESGEWDSERPAAQEESVKLLPAPGSAPSADAAMPPSFELDSPSNRDRSAYRRIWIAGLVLALLVLVGQLVYAGQVPIAGLFGVTLGQSIALDRYRIIDATLDSAPRQPGTLVLSGTLLNRADRTQSLPLLRVMLTDRYGATVGARIFTPRQYGADTHAALKAHRRLMFHVRLADPGSSAVGFSLVLCQHRNHAVWCQGS
jgi:predicted Zn finger-like uncharacterized protein